MANTLKFKCESYGYLDSTDHVSLVDASWNINADSIVAIYDMEQGIDVDSIPASIREKYEIPYSNDIVCPATAITVNDTNFFGYDYPGEIIYVINTNLWIDLYDNEEVLVGDIKDLGATTDLLINALAAKPGNGIVDLGDLNKLGYTVMYMAGQGDLFWRTSETEPYDTTPS